MDGVLKQRVLVFERSKLIDLDFQKYNQETSNTGFDPLHAAAYMILTLRLLG